MNRRRQAFSAILLVMAAAFLVMIWGVAQQFVSSSVRRRARLAEAGRRCLLQATDAVAEAEVRLLDLANRGPPASDSVAMRWRALLPRQVLRFELAPELSQEPPGSEGVRLVRLEVTAWVQGLEGQRGQRPASFDCADYAAMLRGWLRRLPDADQVLADEGRVYGPRWRPPEVSGFVELQATSEAVVTSVRIRKRLTVRRQYRITLSPCRGDEAVRVGVGSFLHLNPIELQRVVETSRDSVRAPVQEEGS